MNTHPTVVVLPVSLLLLLLLLSSPCTTAFFLHTHTQNAIGIRSSPNWHSRVIGDFGCQFAAGMPSWIQMDANAKIRTKRSTSRTSIDTGSLRSFTGSSSTSTSTSTPQSVQPNKSGIIQTSPEHPQLQTQRPKKLILIRHGSSHANEAMDRDGNRWGDDTFTDDATLVDSRLSSKGVEQATSLYQALGSMGVNCDDDDDGGGGSSGSDDDDDDDDVRKSDVEVLKEALDQYNAANLGDVPRPNSSSGPQGVLIATSPLTRTIETLFHGIMPYLHHHRDKDKYDEGEGGQKTNVKIMALALATERVYTASDTGRDVIHLEREFPFVDFSACQEGQSGPSGSVSKGLDKTFSEADANGPQSQSQSWWYTHDPQTDGPYNEWRPSDATQSYAVPGEPVQDFHRRMVRLYEWIESRDEEVIALVTHWAVIRFFTGLEDVENCGVRVVDFGRSVLRDDLFSAYYTGMGCTGISNISSTMVRTED